MKRLLMIDDDEKLVSLVREYLEPHGFEVVATHDGHGGVATVLSAPIGLHVTSIRNGIQRIITYSIRSLVCS